LALAFGTFDAFVVVGGVCACADIEQVKIDNARATLKIDFMTSPRIVRAEISNQAGHNLAFNSN
jgi:hypothetical protein